MYAFLSSGMSAIIKFHSARILSESTGCCLALTNNNLSLFIRSSLSKQFAIFWRLNSSIPVEELTPYGDFLSVIFMASMSFDWFSCTKFLMVITDESRLWISWSRFKNMAFVLMLPACFFARLRTVFAIYAEFGSWVVILDDDMICETVPLFWDLIRLENAILLIDSGRLGLRYTMLPVEDILPWMVPWIVETFSNLLLASLLTADGKIWLIAASVLSNSVRLA